LTDQQGVVVQVFRRRRHVWQLTVKPDPGCSCLGIKRVGQLPRALSHYFVDPTFVGAVALPGWRVADANVPNPFSMRGSIVRDVSNPTVF
jgi:hypothetical protein